MLMQASSLLLFLFVATHVVHSWVLRFRMDRGIKSSTAILRAPSGSLVHHGMTFKESERGVHREQQPSNSYYHRMARL